MDATRYFELMHRAMAARSPRAELLLRVDIQDLGGADAALEVRRDPMGRVRVFASTMGRRSLNFQLFRKGWQQCHNASGELTGRFPARAEELLDEADFDAYIRDDVLDDARAGMLLRVLHHCEGSSTAAVSCTAREGALITADSFVGQGGHWSYWSTAASAPLSLAAVLCWLGDFLAGSERRALQSCPEAVRLAARWQADLASPFARPTGAASPASPAHPAARRNPSPAANPRWQSILAVLATV